MIRNGNFRHKMTEIPVEEAALYPAGLDRNGRLFEWRDGLYRAIPSSISGTYRNLFESGIADRLIQAGIVETEMTTLILANYDLVLKHKVLPFRSYCFEWCGEMLRDAALLTCDLAIELAGYGLGLQDAHPWNILFEGSNARFIDFSSIIPISLSSDTNHFPLTEFWNFFVIPLMLLTEGERDIVSQLLKVNHAHGITEHEFMNSGPSSRTKYELRKLKMKLAILNRISARKVLGELRSFIENIEFEVQPSRWLGYYDDPYGSLSPTNSWNLKQQTCYEIIRRLEPKTLLDIGCNKGWYSQMASRLGSTVVAFDTDEPSVTSLFFQSKENNSSIKPLVIDFRRPSLSFRDDNVQEICYPSAFERFRSEMVLSLALVHHLVFWQRLDFDTIVGHLEKFTSHYLLVEFVPSEDEFVREWYTHEYSWYSLENFQAALAKKFSLIEIFDSHPSPRLLLLCEKR